MKKKVVLPGDAKYLSKSHYGFRKEEVSKLKILPFHV
jgi:hypothetical protein